MNGAKQLVEERTRFPRECVLRSLKRGRRNCYTVAYHLLKDRFGLNYRLIAELFGTTPHMVGYYCRKAREVHNLPNLDRTFISLYQTIAQELSGFLSGKERRSQQQ